MKQGLFRTIAQSSLLYGVVLGLIFLYAYTATPSQIFPSNEAWNLILGIYIGTFTLALLTCLILAPKVVRGLATAKYWESFFKKFLPKAVFWSIVLIFFQVITTAIFKTQGAGILNPLQYINTVPLSVLLIHLFVVSQVEEFIFGGLIYSVAENKGTRFTAEIITIVLFSLWHLAKTQGNIIIMLTYIPLRLWWNYERNHGTPYLNKIIPSLFGPSPRTQQANAGAHFAWNLFVVLFN
jgi:membrane protease YdiL (CAAX protease family)